jgi:hypothetical protein
MAKDENSNPGMLSIHDDDDQLVDVFDNPEPWSPIETKMVVWSFAAAIVALIVFGFLINRYILHAI